MKLRINGWELDELEELPFVELLEVVVDQGDRPWVETCEPPGTGIVLAMTQHDQQVRLCFKSSEQLRAWLGHAVTDLRLEEWVEAAPNL